MIRHTCKLAHQSKRMIRHTCIIGHLPRVPCSRGRNGYHRTGTIIAHNSVLGQDRCHWTQFGPTHTKQGYCQITLIAHLTSELTSDKNNNWKVLHNRTPLGHLFLQVCFCFADAIETLLLQHWSLSLQTRIFGGLFICGWGLACLIGRDAIAAGRRQSRHFHDVYDTFVWRFRWRFGVD